MVTDAQMGLYMAAITASYDEWQNKCAFDVADRTYINETMAKFKRDLKFTVGKKYIKVVREGCGVHSFIVKEDMVFPSGQTWKRGDILKPASWAAPALNFPRGNVVSGMYATVTWTGP